MLVSSGSPLRILASDWNDIQAMLAAYRSGRALFGVAPLANGAVVAWVKNTTSSNLAFGDVLGISDFFVNPATLASEKYEGIRLKGTTPSTSTPHYGRYVVLQEPAAANGGFARAVVWGEAYVKLNITHAADAYCEIADGVTSYLTTAPLGSSRILVKSSGTGSSDKWGIIRVGEASGEILVYNATGSSIAAGASGTATVHTGTPGSESSTGQTLTVRNRSSVAWANAKYGSAAILQNGNAYVSPQQT